MEEARRIRDRLRSACAWAHECEEKDCFSRPSDRFKQRMSHAEAKEVGRAFQRRSDHD